MANNTSKEYLKLVEIENNDTYIYEKSKNYNGIKIGINPNIKIGLEIEANNEVLKDRIFNIETQSKIGEYKSSTDSTVPFGIEVKTPIIHDTEEDLSIFAAVLDTLKEQGYYKREEFMNVSGQINIGLDYLDSAESIIQFFELYGNVEELLYQISNPEGEVIRQSVYANSRMKAISGIIGKQTISEDITREEVIEMLQPDKDKSISGLRFKRDSICIRENEEETDPDCKYRLEYRIPNGSLDCTTWIDNIRLIGRMVEVSKILGDTVIGKMEPTEKQLKLLSDKEELKNEQLDLESKLYRLMDILFDDDETKQIYTNRFYSVQRMILQNENDSVRKYSKVMPTESAFGILHFQRHYQTMIGKEYGSLVFTEEEFQHDEHDDIKETK